MGLMATISMSRPTLPPAPSPSEAKMDDENVMEEGSKSAAEPKSMSMRAFHGR